MSKILKKVTSAFLAAALSLSLLPAIAPTVYAEGGTTGQTVLDKSAELQPDGTYTINLEAYTTGEETVQTSKAPLDIVLVLDVSGSMSNSFGTEDVYTARNSQGYTYNNYGNSTYYYKDNGAYYPVSRGYYNWGGVHYYLSYTKGSTEYYLSGNSVTRTRPSNVTGNRDTIWTGVLYTKETRNVTRLAALKSAVSTFIDGVVADSTAEAQHRITIVKFASEDKGTKGENTKNSRGHNHTQITNDWTVATEPGAASLKTMVNSFTTGGATAAEVGMGLASDQLEAARTDAQKVVVFFTDGEPTHNSSFQDAVANDAIASAKTIKDSEAVIYTVGIFNNPSASVTNYMNYVSSNYPNAESMTVSGTRTPNADFYKLATDASELSEIFSAIATSIQTPTINLGSQSVVKDIISEYFTLPEGFNADSNISVYTMDCTGISDDEQLVFDNKQPFTDAVAEVDTDAATIKVTNFDYKENWCGARSNGTYSGKKLMIEITGIQATEAALKDGYLKTNADGSGIYADKEATTPVEEFPFPEVILYETVYVLDYAKTTSVPTTLKAPSVLGADFTATTIQSILGNYGTFNLSVKNQLYTPSTTKWTGSDSYYAVGKKDGRQEEERVWEKITVMPANNVYYEDSFVTNASIGVSGAEVQCAIGIEYSGSWNVVSTDSGTDPGSNTGSAHIDYISSANASAADTTSQGWIAALADDTGFTDGSAHVATVSTDANGEAASASVSFTGTGIDVYTCTDVDTGVVYAALKKYDDANDAYKLTKLLMLDNKATTGEYYSVPTLSFTGLDYGTYSLKILVSSTPETRAEGRLTYYIDGIRIYNPINPDKENDVVIVGSDKHNAYGNEAGAVFYSLCDMSGLSGSVFVDDSNDQAPMAFVGYDQEGNPIYRDNTLRYDDDGNVIPVYDAEGNVIPSEYLYDLDNTGKNVSLADAGDFMANNEVYLKAGSTISFNVSGGTHYYLAMKSLTGAEVTANVSGTAGKAQAIKLSHTADMYYELTTTGTVTINVTGDGILSLTKLKVTGGSASTTSLEAVTGEEGKALAVAFSTYSIVDYYADPIPEEDLVEEVITEPEVTEEEPEAPVVEIEEPVLPRENSNALGTLELPGLDFSGRDNARTLVTSILASFRSLLR